MNGGFFDEEYFTFYLGSVMYAMEVTNVKEVLHFEKLTRVPKSLPYLKGVMNIRNSVVTIIDLRVLFGIDGDDDIESLPIIVTEIGRGEEAPPMTLGIIADNVNVVTKLESVPSDGLSYGILENRRDFVKSVGKLNGQFVLILDLPVVLRSIEEEIRSLTEDGHIG